jgi:hypothetical protein
MLPPNGWHYGGLTVSRSNSLTRKTSIDQLVADILAGAVVDNIKLKDRCDEAKREKLTAHRVSFGLRPTNEYAAEAMDQLLNGAFGLRARYCSSPEEGSIANASVCRAIAKAILAQQIGAGDDISERALFIMPNALGESLAKSSAKVWFDAPTDKRGVESEDGEVFSEVWKQSRIDQERLTSMLPDLSPQQLKASLVKGLSVPRPLSLDVKAAFTERNGKEYVQGSKRSRAMQIHLLGWT